jgi:tetratricopeptide (TPR) repeat protein
MIEQKIETNITHNELFNKAQGLLLKGEDLPTAEGIFNALFNKSLHDQKNTINLIFQLASLHMRKQNYALAYILFEAVLARDPNILEAVSNKAYVLREMHMRSEARKEFEYLDKMLATASYLKDEDKALYLLNIGSIYIASGTPQKAKEYLSQAISIAKEGDDNSNRAKWNRALANLELGNFEEGFAEYEFGARQEDTQNRYNKLPFWDGTAGKTVVVYGEQGIGDEIMFASIIPDLMKDCKVILDAHPRLQKMFQDNFNIPVYGTRKRDETYWMFHHKLDAKVQIGTLGKFYRKKEEDFPKTPYLKADPKLVEKYREKLRAMGPNKKVGISWKGGTENTNSTARKIKLDMLLPLLKMEGIDFISLQYHEGTEHIVKKFEEQNGVSLNHWSDTLQDYDETAGLVTNLDIVISVPQSVVHLCGALGVRTIQLCPIKAMWQMGVYGKNMPWYESVENIWQQSDGDWGVVIENAKEKLKERLWSLSQINIAA